MKKSYSFLEKKLQEIKQAHIQNEDIKPRIEFLKTLISAEVSLSPHSSDSIPPPLRSISEQLTRLESGYLKGKDCKTTSPGSVFSDYDKCEHQEDTNDPMPELETAKASPEIAEKTVSNHKANEKSRGLKIYWCGCLVIMMSIAVIFMMGAISMLSYCGCSGYYYHNNIRLQYTPAFITPT